MTKTLLLTMLLTSLLVSASAASACECPAKPGPEAAFEQASLVFVGRVDDIRKDRYRKGDNQVRFIILKKLKGFEEVRTEKVYVYTDQDKGMCGYKFQHEAEYLVYAYGSPARFTTNACTRTIAREISYKEIRKLEKLAGRDARPTR